MILYELRRLLDLNKLNLLEEGTKDLQDKIIEDYAKNIIVHLAKIRYTNSVLFDYNHWAGEIITSADKIHGIISKKAKINRKIKLDSLLQKIENVREKYYKEVTSELKTYTIVGQINFDYLYNLLINIIKLIVNF